LSISNPSRGIVAWASRSVSRTNEETIANARLIAAAPDLLAALRNSREYIQADFEGIRDPRENELLDEIAAAIKKAEGRA